MLRYIYALLIIGSSASPLFSQMRLQLRHAPWASIPTTVQPALLGRGDYEYAALSADAQFWFNTNGFRVDRILQDGNTLSSEVEDEILAELRDGDNLVQLGTDIHILAQTYMGELPVSIGFKTVDQLFFDLNTPETATLLLKGNAFFAGQSVSDESLQLRDWGYQEISLGTAFDFGETRLGIRAKFLLGERASFYDDLSYELFTEADGIRVDVASVYEVFDTGTDGIDGYGAGIDLGITHRISEKWEVHVAALDLGFISWDGRIRNNTVNFSYEGLEVENIISIGDEETSLDPTDTLTNLFFPTEEFGTTSSPLAGSVHLSGFYHFDETAYGVVSLHSGLTRYGNVSDIPLLNLAYYKQWRNRFMLGVNMYGGGLDRYGLGASGGVRLPFGDRGSLQFLLQTDNITGLFFGQGIAVNGGLSVGY
ncbi:MAG: DUF5723 family protein [Bacteroidota bacterium]